MKCAVIFSLLLVAIGISAQQAETPFSIYNQTGRLPDGCVGGYSAGMDTVIYSIPYTYAQVMSIIGSYRNLTWSGNPYTSVTLNGTDNTVGTARTYDIAGAHVVETITTYQKPVAGPYNEVHTVAPASIPAANFSFYSAYDGATVTSICGGTASQFNLTIDFCATDALLAATTLHMLHVTDATTVGVFLGGQNFTSCAAIDSTSSTNATTNSGNATMSSGPQPSTFTGQASLKNANALTIGLVALIAILL